MIECDSSDYRLLSEAAASVVGIPGMTCEIGVRKGGGTKCIIDGLLQAGDEGRTHLCIDPYGSLPFIHGVYVDPERGVLHLQDPRGHYCNAMRCQCMIDLLTYAQNLPVNLLFFTLTDTQFFRLFAGGVPVYERQETTLGKYALVHVDGEHSLGAVVGAIEFFHARMSLGGAIVLDDIDRFDHELVKKWLQFSGWQLIEEQGRKASYRKVLATPLDRLPPTTAFSVLDAPETALGRRPDPVPAIPLMGSDATFVLGERPGFVGEAGE